MHSDFLSFDPYGFSWESYIIAARVSKLLISNKKTKIQADLHLKK